ncbi:type II toxin-antitoxin system PemK/MazF family toxin [Streptomyces sp. NPDC002306]
MIRGAVYEFNFGKPTDKRGHEQIGRRYAIVVAHPYAGWSTALVVPTSTSAQSAIFRPAVVVDGIETLALVDQLRAVDVQFAVGQEPVELLSTADMSQIMYALAGLLKLPFPELEY